MERRMIINIVGEQNQGDEIKHIEFTTFGRYREEGGMRTIEYDETEPMGTENSTTTLTVNGDIVSLARKGNAMNHHLVFELGKKCVNVFNTPFGCMEMGVYPTSAHLDMSEQGGSVELSYDLDMEGHYVGRNVISLRFSPQNTYDRYYIRHTS